MPNAKTVGTKVMPGATPTTALQAAVAAPPELDEIDGHLPRWRRPSLMEARKADPLRSESTS